MSNAVELSAAQHAAAMSDYAEAGLELSRQIGNRGPLRLNSAGRLGQDVLDAYWEHGFYVFEGVIDAAEVEELRGAIDDVLERAPVDRDASVDKHGNPAAGHEFSRGPFTFIKPLSDPWGGTELLGGRHPHQMQQPKPAADAPSDVVYLIHGMCQLMEPGLRLYGHPGLLGIAASLNGEDFVPFNDAIFVKQPGLGGSVAWHQDGVTHWNSPDWDIGIHGFNFQVQLYRTTPQNSLWVVPGTHKLGRVDIRKRISENGGSEQLPGAVPLVCEPGDVTIVNRQLLHGSFANTSDDIRVSVTFGFHRYKSVLGARGALSQKPEDAYDAQRIDDRAAVIQVAIDARAQKYPQEPRFQYAVFEGREDSYRWNPETFERVIRDYNLKDLAI